MTGRRADPDPRPAFFWRALGQYRARACVFDPIGVDRDLTECMQNDSASKAPKTGDVGINPEPRDLPRGSPLAGGSSVEIDYADAVGSIFFPRIQESEAILCCLRVLAENAVMHPLLESLSVDLSNAPDCQVSESAWSVVVSRLPRLEALQIVRSAARHGLLAEAIKPLGASAEWRAVILKPLDDPSSMPLEAADPPLSGPADA